MNKQALTLTLATVLAASPASAMECKYTRGESKFVDYANCRYGEDSILVVDLPEGSAWDNCVYQMQAFMPEKLLAVTKEKDGIETASINDRTQIGNPCYMTKRICDAALQAHKAGLN